MTTKIPDHIRSFSRRGSRLTPFQETAINSYLSKYQLKQESEQKLGVKDLANIFGNNNETILEIGYGNGDSLFKQCQRDTNTNFIGVEIHRPGIGRLVGNCHNNDIDNLKVICEDAFDVCNNWFCDGIFDRIQVFFPDPWHKKRHNKRRLLNKVFLTKLLALLKPNGVLFMVTDWQDYYENIVNELKTIDGHKKSNNFDIIASMRFRTKYEERAIRLKHKINNIIIEKI